MGADLVAGDGQLQIHHRDGSAEQVPVPVYFDADGGCRGQWASPSPVREHGSLA